MSSISLHEPAEQLTERTINCHRAIVSLMEELEAIDWYSQRADACSDADCARSSSIIATKKSSMRR